MTWPADGRPHRGDQRRRPRQHLHPGDAADAGRSAGRVRAAAPERRDDRERPPLSGRPARELAPGPGPLAGRTVLVAEDNAANQAVVVAMLEILQVRALVAGTGHEALACLAAQPVDAVLMDVQMPGLDGLSATRAWRRRGGSAAGPCRSSP
jgi:PleD family two-component response regulator